MKHKRILICAFSVLLTVACAAGEKGPAGERGHSCTVSEKSDRTKVISCEDGTTVTLTDGVDGSDGKDGQDGKDGAKGDSCSVADNQDGTKTLTCEDGTEVVIRDGEKGQAAACANNAPPVFEGATLTTPLDLPFLVNQPATLRVAVADPDGDALTVDFAGMGVSIEPTAEAWTWTVRPRMEGGPFQYTVSVTDGCHIVAGSFTIQRVRSAPRNLTFFVSAYPSGADVWTLDSNGDGDLLGDFPVGNVRGFAINPVDGQGYLHVHGGTADDGLHRFNLFTGDLDFIGTTGLEIPDMTFSPDGTLFAYTEAGEIVTIDVDTGESTTVTTINADRPLENVGIAFRGDVLYLKDEVTLYTVNLETGDLVRLGELDSLENGLIAALEYDSALDSFLVAERIGGDTFIYKVEPDTLLTGYYTKIDDDNVIGIGVLAPGLTTELRAFAGRESARVVWTFEGFESLAYLTWSPNGPAKPIRIDPERAWTDGSNKQIAFDGVDFDFQWPVTGLEPDTTYTISLYLVNHSGAVSREITTTVRTLAAPDEAKETMYGLEEDGVLYKVDPATGALSRIGDTGLARAGAFAINPADGKAYLVSNDTKKLYEVNLETAEVNEIGDTGLDNVRDLMFTSEGELVGTNRDSDFVQLDLETGAGSSILSLPLEWATGIAEFNGTGIFKIRNDLVIFDEFGDQTLATVIGPIDYHLGNSLTFSSSGYGYTLEHNWDVGSDGINTLFRIDQGSYVAIPVVTYEEGIRLTSVDFLREAAE